MHQMIYTGHKAALARKLFIFKSVWLLNVLCFLVSFTKINAQSTAEIKTKELTFKSEGVTLAGTLYTPENPFAALVVVHGSGQELRMGDFAMLLAKNGIAVYTYDKRGVGASGGVYAGPEVGTNNIDSLNIDLLAKDASAAITLLHKSHPNTPIGLLGFSQAGWIIPLAATKNPQVNFMVLFSCPTVTTLEQLRFQFYTNGNTSFWQEHTEEEAKYHLLNDPDRYQFTASDPKQSLNALSIPGLWLFGEQDIQIPVKYCMEHLNTYKVKGKPYEYCLFPALGHNTAFADTSDPVDIAILWIKQKIRSM